MKPLSHNNFGNIHLVELCQKIRADQVIKQIKKDINKAILEARIAVDGFEVGITTTNLYSGGKRFWFVCPLCKLPVGIVYRHPLNTALVGCRRCLKLDYRSRRYRGMVEEKIT